MMVKKKVKNAANAPPAEALSGDTQAGPFDELISEGRALFLVVAATVLAYANSLSGAFVFDDTKQIAGNPALHSWNNIFRAFTSDVWSFERGALTAGIPLPYYRPLFTAYLTLNYQLFGLWEPGWHLINLLVHATATLLVYFFLKRLSADVWIAMLGALIFGVHPVHVESVSWISGIPDPLAALFYVPSMIWYLRYRSEDDLSPRGKWLAASVVAFGLSLLCKETSIVLPLVLATWELASAKQTKDLALTLKEIVLRMIPYTVTAVAYLAVRFSVLGMVSWRHPLAAPFPRATIWLTVPYVFVSYVKHLLAPFYLSLIYGPAIITSAGDPRFLLSIGFLLCLAFILWIYRTRLTGEVSLAIVLLIAPLLPVLNLRVFHYEYVIQDRYLYLPSIGFCYLVAICIMRLARQYQSIAVVISAVIILAFGASTILQNRVWHDAVALWQRATYYSPESWSTHYNLGLAYLGFDQYEPAQTELLEAKRLDPNKANVYNNLAMAQVGLGRTDDAISNLKAALAIDPRLLEAHNNLGRLLCDKGDYAASNLELTHVLESDPSSISARFNLARTLAAMGDHGGAIREYQTVLGKDPNDVVARYQLGLSLAATGKKAEALSEFSRALQLDGDANRAAEMRKKLEQIQKQ